MLDELAEYEPPLELLSKLPSSPFSQSRRRARWWSDRKGKEKEWLSSLRGFKEAEDGRELVRVLTGEEELEGLNTPKVCVVRSDTYHGLQKRNAGAIELIHDLKGILITGPPGMTLHLRHRC